jgi:hypothetical protein
MTLRRYSSRSQQTTLSGAITSGATTMTVVSGSALLGGVDPSSLSTSATFTVVIDPDTAVEEIVDVTQVSTNTFTIVRSVDTVAGAQSHSAGAVVRHMAIGRDYRDANLHTQASASYNDGSGNAQSLHGIAAGEGDVVGTAKTQTLTNKTLTSPTISNPIFTGTPSAGASIVFEGAVVDDYETTLTVAEPTQDNTITLPNTTGTVVLANAVQTLTNKTIDMTGVTLTGLSSAGMVSSSATPKDYVDSILGSATAASTSAASALVSANSASASAVSANTSAIAASTSAVQASTSAASASVSQIAANTSAIAASTSAASALVSATSAGASVAAVQASAAAASTSAASASVSQIAAQTSAASAATSASNASGSAISASTSAASAAASAVSANTSAVNASTSAVNASTSAASASVSAIAASTSAASALVSANSATAAVSSIEGFSIAAQTSAASAAASAIAASTSEVNASTSAASASVSAIAASTSAVQAEAAWDEFDDRYLGAKASPPTVDNDGNPLVTGALYWSTAVNQMFVWDGSAWGGISSTADIFRYKYTATGGETSFSGPDDNALTLSYLVGKEQVYLNGVLLVRGTDYVASNGTSIASLAAVAASDILEVITFTAFDLASAIEETLFEAKGDLLSASAAGTPSRVPVGTDGFYLKADSATTSGLAWAAIEAGIDPVSIVMQQY